MFAALLAEARYLLMQLLLATCVWLLPQKLHWTAFKLLARMHPLLLRVAPAVNAIVRFKPTLMPYRKTLLLGCALHQLVDQADYYLTRKYGAEWLRQNVVVDDVLPKNLAKTQPGSLFLTPHYGQGFWAIKYFNVQHQLPLAWLHLPPAAKVPLGERAAAWMGRKRIRQVERLAASVAIPTGGSVQAMKERLCDHGMPVLAMPDVPPAAGRGNLIVSLLQQAAWMPGGVFSLAVREGVPVFMYTMSLDRETGMRRLKVYGPCNNRDVHILARQFADMLTKALHEDPCAWHLWEHAESFFNAGGD